MSKTPKRSEQSRLSEAIGHVIMMWSNVESVLGNCLADALEVDREKATLLLAGASGRRRIEHLLSMIELKSLNLGTDTDNFTKILKDIFSLVEQRNLVAHSTWVAYDDNGELARVKFSPKRGELGHYPASPEALYEFGQQIGQCIKQMDAIWLRYFPENESILRIPPLPFPEDSDEDTQP